MPFPGIESSPRRAPHLPKPAAIRDLAITHRPPSPASGSILLQLARANQAAMGEEAATPGLPVALARATGLSPGNFTLEKLPDTAGSAAINQQILGTHVFAATHSPPIYCARQHKTMNHLCRSCGRSLFPVEDRGKPESNCRRISRTGCTGGRKPGA